MPREGEAMRRLFSMLFTLILIGLVIYGWYNYRLNTARDPRLAPLQARLTDYYDKGAVCPTCHRAKGP